MIAVTKYVLSKNEQVRERGGKTICVEFAAFQDMLGFGIAP